VLRTWKESRSSPSEGTRDVLLEGGLSLDCCLVVGVEEGVWVDCGGNKEEDGFGG